MVNYLTPSWVRSLTMHVKFGVLVHLIYNIEKVHLSFCKRVLNVKTSTSTLAIYSKLGRYPLYVNRYCGSIKYCGIIKYCGTIKYWCTIVQSNNIILKCLYADMLKQLNNRKTNWLVNVK